MRVRAAAPSDLDALVAMRSSLWPDAAPAEHRAEAEAILGGRPRSTLPLALFVAERDGRVVGFAEVSLRSHADGCDPSRPCGFLEGWYVEPASRRHGAGRALVAAAERWCGEQGCRELASDTWLDSEASQRAHAALGFELVDRCVNYRKPIAAAAGSARATAHYGAALARIHHEHFGTTARAAARELLRRLAAVGVTGGRVVELAAGSGILSRAVTEAGFEAWGVDLSPEMLRIARAEAPGATLVEGSLWSVELPRCVAVTAVGEAFSYAADPAAGLQALAPRLAAIHGALEPGGLLLFDVAGPGRSGPGGSRRSFWAREEACLGLSEREHPEGRLERALTVFTRRGELFERSEETHVLRLYAPEAIEELLGRTGFACERLAGYDDFTTGPGWHAFAAVRR